MWAIQSPVFDCLMMKMPDSSLSIKKKNAHYYNGVPDYMTDTYDWAYVDPVRVKQLDRNLVVSTLLFGNDQRLIQAYLDEIQPGMRVWQVAHVYGDLVRRAAQKVGPDGVFHLTDITPIQVEHGQKKLADLTWSKVFQHDAATFTGEGGSYDLICSFFLLHEVPDHKKTQILDRKALRKLRAETLKLRITANNQSIISVNSNKDGPIKVLMETFTKKLLEKFWQGKINPSFSPLGMDKLHDDDPPDTEAYPVRPAIGNFIWLVINLRFDIAPAVNYIARRQTKPSAKLVRFIKRVFRYLSATTDFALVYKSVPPACVKLQCSSDSSFDVDTMGGYAWFLGDSLKFLGRWSPRSVLLPLLVRLNCFSCALQQRLVCG